MQKNKAVEQSADFQRTVASHEAGHAVVAHVLGFNLQIVSLDPDPDNPSVLAYTRFDEKEVTPETVEDIMAALVTVQLAGLGAERAIYGKPVLFANALSDLKKVENLLSFYAEVTSDTYQQLLGQFTSEAQHLVDQHRGEVAALTEALLAQRRLSGVEVQRILAEA